MQARHRPAAVLGKMVPIQVLTASLTRPRVCGASLRNELPFGINQNRLLRESGWYL